MNNAAITSNVSALTGGGMRLSQHWSNVASAGHQWNTTLNNGNWDWVVLQDQAKFLDSLEAKQNGVQAKTALLNSLKIEDNGGETVLMMTWGRRDGDSNNAWRFQISQQCRMS